MTISERLLKPGEAKYYISMRLNEMCTIRDMAAPIPNEMFCKTDIFDAPKCSWLSSGTAPPPDEALALLVQRIIWA